MKFQRIVGLGDSWMWGDELVDPRLPVDTDSCASNNRSFRESKCFFGQIAAHYGVPAVNLAWPGSSLQSMIWTYLWWLENRPHEVDSSLVLVGLTGASRHSFYNPQHVSLDATDPPWNRFVHDQWFKHSPHLFSSHWQDLLRLNTALTQCDQLDNLKYQQAVWFFHGQGLVQSHKVLQFNIIDPPCTVGATSLCNSTKPFYNWFLDQNPSRLTKHQHPDLIGHEIIRDMLISEIDRVILSE